MSFNLRAKQLFLRGDLLKALHTIIQGCTRLAGIKDQNRSPKGRYGGVSGLNEPAAMTW